MAGIFASNPKQHLRETPLTREEASVFIGEISVNIIYTTYKALDVCFVGRYLNHARNTRSLHGVKFTDTRRVMCSFEVSSNAYVTSEARASIVEAPIEFYSDEMFTREG